MFKILKIIELYGAWASGFSGERVTNQIDRSRNTLGATGSTYSLEVIRLVTQFLRLSILNGLPRYIQPQVFKNRIVSLLIISPLMNIILSASLGLRSFNISYNCIPFMTGILTSLIITSNSRSCIFSSACLPFLAVST